jgi:hypothetical protein
MSHGALRQYCGWWQLLHRSIFQTMHLAGLLSDRIEANVSRTFCFAPATAPVVRCWIRCARDR